MLHAATLRAAGTPVMQQIARYSTCLAPASYIRLHPSYQHERVLSLTSADKYHLPNDGLMQAVIVLPALFTV